MHFFIHFMTALATRKICQRTRKRKKKKTQQIYKYKYIILHWHIETSARREFCCKSSFQCTTTTKMQQEKKLYEIFTKK